MQGILVHTTKITNVHSKVVLVRQQVMHHAVLQILTNIFTKLELGEAAKALHTLGHIEGGVHKAPLCKECISLISAGGRGCG